MSVGRLDSLLQSPEAADRDRELAAALARLLVAAHVAAKSNPATAAVDHAGR